MLKKIKKTAEKKTATATTAKAKKAVAVKKKVEAPKPKSKIDLLKEKIEEKSAEHQKAASKGPAAAAPFKKELKTLREELSNLLK